MTATAPRYQKNRPGYYHRPAEHISEFFQLSISFVMIIEIGIAIKTITRTTLLQGRAQMNVRNSDHVKIDFDDSYSNEALEYKPTDSYMKKIKLSTLS